MRTIKDFRIRLKSLLDEFANGLFECDDDDLHQFLLLACKHKIVIDDRKGVFSKSTEALIEETRRKGDELLEIALHKEEEE